MNKNLRITVRFEAPVREQIEQLIKEGKYKNISQLVRTAVNKFLEKKGMTSANNSPDSTHRYQNKNDNDRLDSTTEVHLLDSPRKSVSFKCNEKLWKSFVSAIKAQGLSVCHILEAMIFGWLEGKVHLSHTIKPFKIENLVVKRAVKRVRRYATEDSVGSERRFYCALKDCHVPVESLPLSDCQDCPNPCRSFVRKKVEGEDF